MNTRLFPCPIPTFSESQPGNFIYHFYLPTLSAFLVTEVVLTQNGLTLRVDRSCVSGNEISISTTFKLNISVGTNAFFNVGYLGIGDACKLFPRVEPIGKRSRMAELYREGESALASRSWLAVSLAAGGVCEGLLNGTHKAANFHDAISNAVATGVLNAMQGSVLNELRTARNLIHANRYVEPMVTPEQAMAGWRTMNDMIDRFAC